MHLLFNDLSLHGQFSDFSAFKNAIDHLMSMRVSMHRYGRELYCARDIHAKPVMYGVFLQQAVGKLQRDQNLAFTQWITRRGPFWSDERLHGPDEYLECRGEVVTDTAVGEVAFCRINNHDAALVSLTPSSWAFSPVPVSWIRDTGSSDVSVDNFWTCPELEQALEKSSRPVTSWTELEQVCRQRFPGIVFSEKCFTPLDGYPFSESAASRIVDLLGALAQLNKCFDDRGRRTAEGHEIYQQYFTGSKAWFSDSSDTEKAKFRTEMTFQHPGSGQNVFCPWHGKIKTPQYRIHFTGIPSTDEQLCVVYIGPKITKR